MTDTHNHDHGPAENREDEHYFDHIYLAAGHDKNAKRTLWVVWLTAITMVVEIAAGYITGSMALLADGFHMATHAGALCVAALAYRYARIHARNPRFTFGTGKVGDLAGFASALVLAIVSLGIAIESGMRLFQPIHVEFGQATLIATIGLAINIVSAFMLSEDHSHHGHSHGHGHSHDTGHDHDDHDHPVSTAKHRDNNLRAAYIHVLADALTSVLAIAALLAGRYLGWLWLDPVIGIMGAVVIAKWSWNLMGDTAAILLDTAEPQLTARIRTLVEAQGATIADLHVWRVGPHAHAAIISLAATPDVANIRLKTLALPGMEHVTVECLG